MVWGFSFLAFGGVSPGRVLAVLFRGGGSGCVFLVLEELPELVGSGRERLNSKVVWPIAHLCGDTATKAMTWSSFSWLYLLLLCLSRQISHLVWPGMAGLGQVLHRPASFFSCRTFFAWTLAASFRSAVWFLACSYKRRASRCSSGVLLGFGSFRGFSFLGLGFLTFLALLGFWLGSGLVSSKRCWKVLSSVRGWGATTASKRITPNSKGLSPRVRGNHPFALGHLVILGSIPASAGQP